MKKRLLSGVAALLALTVSLGLAVNAAAVGKFELVTSEGGKSTMTATDNGVKVTVDKDDSRIDVIYSEKLDATKPISFDLTVSKWLAGYYWPNGGESSQNIVVSLSDQKAAPDLGEENGTYNSLIWVYQIHESKTILMETACQHLTTGGYQVIDNSLSASYPQHAFAAANEGKLSFKINLAETDPKNVVKVNDAASNVAPDLSSFKTLFADKDVYLTVTATMAGLTENFELSVENISATVRGEEPGTGDSSDGNSSEENPSSQPEKPSDGSSEETPSTPAEVKGFILASESGKVTNGDNGDILAPSETEPGFMVNTNELDLSKPISFDVTVSHVYGCAWGPYLNPARPSQWLMFAISDDKVAMDLGEENGKANSVGWLLEAHPEADQVITMASFVQHLKTGAYSAVDAKIADQYPQFPVKMEAKTTYSIKIDFTAADAKMFTVNGKPVTVAPDMSSIKSLFQGKTGYLSIGTTPAEKGMNYTVTVSNLKNGDSALGGDGSPQTGIPSELPFALILTASGFAALGMVVLKKKNATTK